jgi:carbon-monoxide dehydrogenase large subunit
MSAFGRSVRRVEDAALLAGSEKFVDDQESAREASHLVVLRSAFAHSGVRLGSVPHGAGVTMALGAHDVGHLAWPQLLAHLPPVRPLAGETVRYQGEPIAAVVADTRRAGLDAIAGIDVDYDVRPAAATVAKAVAPDAPLVYPELGTNIAYTDESSREPGGSRPGTVVLRRDLIVPRIAPGMLECRAFLAVPDGSGLTVYAGHQNAHKLRDELATLLDLDADAIRVIAPAVGGGFGAKSSFYPEYALAAFAALESGKPVKFIESRSENLLLTAHGRAQTQRVEVTADGSGRLLALDVEVDADFGASADIQRWCIALTRRMLSGAYDIAEIGWRMRGVLTHTPPVGAFRGAGRPEAAYLVERVVDEVARHLDLDPVAVRRANFIAATDFPHETPTGVTYDSGDYEASLDAAVELAGYDEWVDKRDRRRADGDRLQLGVGVATCVEMTAGGGEFAAVSIDIAGEVVVHTGTSPHGQGHATAWAQLVAEALGVPLERISVVHGDTRRVPRGGGTSGSRSASLGGSSVSLAANRLAERLRDLAAAALEAAPEDIRLDDGRARVVGTDVAVSLGALAASEHGGSLRQEEVFEAPGQTFPFGSVVCVVEVDVETGEVHVISYTSVDDCGTVINPLLVEGQINGGMLQGMSLALREESRFDGDGMLLSGNLTTYHLPQAREMPSAATRRTETPSPNNPLGVKGVGELGTTGATPAVANATIDALAGLGVDTGSLQIPFTPDRVWTAVREVAR